MVLILLKWMLMMTLFLLLIGIIYEQYSRWQLEKNIRKGKSFALVNGHQLHYVKKGKGNCTVVFESGLASDHINWVDVQQQVANYAVTISYDRSGMFLSESGDGTKTNASIVNDLEQLLEKTRCPKPYIMVGHSIGGIYLRLFVKQNKEDIAGIMLLESAHPLQIKKSSAAMLKAFAPPPAWIMHFILRTGIFRILFNFIQVSPEIPLKHPFHIHFRKFFYRSYPAILLEYRNDVKNLSEAESHSFGNIPLTVIMGASDIWSKPIKDPVLRTEFHKLVEELQKDHLNLSSCSKFVIAEKSGHIVQVNDSELIAEEIIKLLP